MFLRRRAGLCFVLLFAFTYADEGCDKWQCKGPIKYYEELKCKPVYAKPGDCCAVRYDCSHLEGRSADKCYVNGREYAVDEELKKEDRGNACQIGCRCAKDYSGETSFICASVRCSYIPVKEGCFLKEDPDDCCPSEEVCPKEGEEKVTCEVDGKTYYEGKSFKPEGKPLLCSCMKGFKGELVEPFCHEYSCGTELHYSSSIYNKCAPVFYHIGSPAIACSMFHRCPNNKDVVIKRAALKSSSGTSAGDKTNNSESVEHHSDMKCTFGNMTMDIGDELNQATDYSSVCVKCVCEVPPTPTCRKLSDKECDVTKHPNFDHFH